jgi:hypothetical protein
MIYLGVHSTEDVGFGTDTWTDPYVGSGDHIDKALAKYGRTSFVVEVVSYFDAASFAYDAERFIVTQEWLDEMGDRTYNLVPGGDQPPNHSKSKWINDGSFNKRLPKDKEIPIGWIAGRLMLNDENRIMAVRRDLAIRNKQNNPMSNNEVVAKMTATINEQYANGRKSSNQYTKNKEGYAITN